MDSPNIRKQFENVRSKSDDTLKASIDKLMLEVSIYQTELHMQNEELRKNQLELQQTKIKYEYLFNLAPISYFIINEECRIVEVNEKGTQLLGLSENDINTKKFTDFIYPKHQDIFYLFFRQLVQNNESEFCEVAVKGKSGIIHTQVQAVSVKIVENRRQVFIAVTDIDRRLENEAKLISQNNELIKVNNELDKFTYSASHDLRAPLASIKGLTYLYGITDKEEEKDDYVKKIERSVEKLDEYVSEILQFSRNTNGKVENSLINFRTMINEIFETLAHYDVDRKISKHLSINSEADPFYCDYNRLRMVLNNLITNAIKYSSTDKKGHKCWIRVNIDIGDVTKIMIKDNGIGIEEKRLPHIFDMFYRANDKTHGSGLGLYIVKEIVNKLKGSLSVKSKVGKGSEFLLTLPNLKE